MECTLGVGTAMTFWTVTQNPPDEVVEVGASLKGRAVLVLLGTSLDSTGIKLKEVVKG